MMKWVSWTEPSLNCKSSGFRHRILALIFCIAAPLLYTQDTNPPPHRVSEPRGIAPLLTTLRGI